MLKGFEVDREGPIAFITLNLHPVITGDPLGKLREIAQDPVGVGAEVMWPVRVNEHTMFVVAIVGVAANMVALFNDEAPFPVLRTESLGCNKT